VRAILDMDTCQIEVTNVCRNSCANCSRMVGHVEPYFMDFAVFCSAIDSMIGYPRMIGFQGGEPLLHPEFERMCDYAASRFEPRQLGLWTTLPEGYEKYREIICRTFGHIFINDHSRSDIYHCPVLVGIEEVVEDQTKMWDKINHCWAQESWSASINPRGAFFCEIAAAMAILYPEEPDEAWSITPGWWSRMPWEFGTQIKQWCPQCGFACNLSRRSSLDSSDDISPRHLARLQKSPKIRRGQYVVHPLTEVAPAALQPLAAYKDTEWRNSVAARYGMFLIINDQQFWTPILKATPYIRPHSIYEQFRERWA